ncbi:MAG: hypothetical protein K6U74_02425 [Firmicutes bacterium]|nr:hypothetical protein [Bacillota bacterium]
MLVHGKRIGHGFVTGRQELIDALGQVDTMAVRIGDIFVGRAALIAYLKNARGAASTVKVVPTGESLRIEHGSMGMVELPQWKWIKPKERAKVMADSVYLEVGDRDKYLPNVGALDLAKALEKALIVTAAEKDASQPSYTMIVLHGDGENLHVRATDGKRACEASIPAGVNGTGYVNADEARGMIRMLRKAKSARLDVLTTTRNIRDTGEDKTVEIPYVVLLADAIKLECLPNQIRHSLSEKVPEQIVPTDISGRFYLGAKELGEVLRSAGMVAGDEEDRSVQPVFVTMRPGAVEFSSYVKNKDNKQELNMTVAVECETEGTFGETCLNIKLVLPVLKTFGTGSVEIAIPKKRAGVTFRDNNGTFFLIAPLNLEKPVEEPKMEEPKAEAKPEEEPKKSKSKSKPAPDAKEAA